MEIVINEKKLKIDIANTFIKRLLGLMFQKEIKKGLFFPNTGSIHTFFMRSNIDIIMLNKENIVVYYEKNVSKNRIIIKKEAQHTIELPPNYPLNIQIGDRLIFK